MIVSMLTIGDDLFTTVFTAQNGHGKTHWSALRYTYLCGDVPCINRIEEALLWVFARGVFLLAALAASAFFALLMFVSISRHLPYKSQHKSHDVRFYADSVPYPLLDDANIRL